ncbi:glycosyl transferase [Opitutaceae bacterium TAV1]|nr:glycosyl transferase [Opitutaceae bacterium TAV1]
MRLINRSIFPFALILAIFCAILAFGWLRQTPSFEELQGGAARSADYFRGMESVKGWLWWTPNYLLGHSQALQGLSLLPLFVLNGIAALLSPWMTVVSAFKLVGVSLIFFGGLAMFSFVRRLTSINEAALLCGLFYATSAQFVMRIAMLEHLTTAACMVLGPLILLSLLRCEQNANWRNTALLAVSVAAMILCYVKIFLLFLPCAIVFVMWRYFTGAVEARAKLRQSYFRGALLTIPMALLPLLPTLRESHWLAGFELEPFASWQYAFSFYSGISWLDYWNVLTSGSFLSALNTFRHPVIDFFLGIPVFLGIFLPVVIARHGGRWETLLQGTSSHIFRFACLSFFLALWLASGPKSILSSHLEFLKAANHVPDPSIALVWLLFVLQGFAIWQLCGGIRWLPALRASALIIMYFAVPGFRLLEHLPFYSDIRAPSSVWAAFGTLAATLASGSGWILIWKKLNKTSLPSLAIQTTACLTRRKRYLFTIAGAALVLIFCVDCIFLHREFFKKGLPEKLFTDFGELQKELAKGDVQGSVYWVSGHYFYLATPALSGRAITSEALLRHFQTRWNRHMENQVREDLLLFKTWINYSGVAYIVVDRRMSSFPELFVKAVLDGFPEVFRNEHFILLKNASSLSPAYFATSALRGSDDSYKQARLIIGAASRGQPTVENSYAAISDNDKLWAGTITETGKLETPNNFLPQKLTPLKLRLSAPRSKNYHEFTVEGLPEDNSRGFLFVPETWHPDWTAQQDGKPLPVLRGMGQFLTVIPQSSSPVTFRFVPPAWYGVCLTLGTASWLVALSAFIVCLLSKRARHRWTMPFVNQAKINPPTPVRDLIKRPLVIIPTYNEAENITRSISLALAAAPDVSVLIVDDNSPDGTAGIIKAHSAFGSRLHLLSRVGKLGLGTAYKEAFQWAIHNNYDACIEMDADLSHDPADVPRLIDALDNANGGRGADAAIGSRYINGVRVMNWPEHRLLLSTSATRYVRFMTGLPLTDATSGFKALRTSALSSLDWSRFKADGYGFQIELHYFLWRTGAALTEVPIVFTERRGGQTKMNWKITIEAFLCVLKLALSGRGNR